MKILKLMLALLMTSLSLLGCVSESKVTNEASSNNNNAHAPQLRAVHLSPDAPAVDVSVNGAVALQDVMYRQASGFLSVSEGSTNVKVLAANTTNAVIDANLDLMADTKYTVIAVDKLSKIMPLVIEDTNDKPTAGFATLNVVHGAASAAAVDVYLSEPSADFSGLAPTLQGVSFKDSSGELEVMAGDYRVRVTAAASSNVIYDSGTIGLDSGIQYIAIAADNTKGGTSPIGLSILTDSSMTPFINVEDSRSKFRVVHASANAPNVDVLVNNSVLASLTDVPFGVGSSYLTVQPDTYNVKVAATGSVDAVIEADLTLEPSTDYTIAAINPLATIKPLVLEDDNTPPADGNVKLRLVHAAPSAGLVDIYVVAADIDIEKAQPLFTSVAFEANTGYLEVAEGTYKVVITLAGTKTVAIDTGSLTLSAGQIRTAFAIDPAPSSSAFGVILLEDLN